MCGLLEQEVMRAGRLAMQFKVARHVPAFCNTCCCHALVWHCVQLMYGFIEYCILCFRTGFQDEFAQHAGDFGCICTLPNLARLLLRVSRSDNGPVTCRACIVSTRVHVRRQDTCCAVEHAVEEQVADLVEVSHRQ